MIDFEKYMIAEEGFFSKIVRKMEEKGRLQQQKLLDQNRKEARDKKATIDVDEFYSQFHVSLGQRDNLRKVMFNNIVREADKIISNVNKNKTLMNKFISSGKKQMMSDYDDQEMVDEDIQGDEKFSCEEEYEYSPTNGLTSCGIYVGENFSQSGCSYIVSGFIEDYLCPELRKKFSNISRVVKFRLGGDGDEGFMDIDFSF